jgi:hypothetical protein
MNHPVVYVGFERQQVAVRSDAPEILDGIEHSYRRMIEAEPGNVVGELEVYRNDGTYLLRGITEASLQDNSLREVLRCLDYEIVLRLIEARPDLIWLHAGAVAHGESAVLLCGPWGHGKSALVIALCQNSEWRYLSDDIVPLDPFNGKIIPFSQSPTIREIREAPLPDSRRNELRKLEVEMGPETICAEATAVHTVVFPSYRFGLPPELTLCSPAICVVELLKNCLNFKAHGEAAVQYFCGLVSRATCYNLWFDDRNSAAKLIADISHSETSPNP